MSDPVSPANPYDYVSDIKDRTLFAGRRSELALIGEELAGLAAPRPISPVIALVGERRVGKTSLLHRISEICAEKEMLPCQINVTNMMAADAGEFWFEAFQRLLASANRAGVISLSPASDDVGFRQGGIPEERKPSTPEINLFSWYMARAISPSAPPTNIVSRDFNSLCEVLLSAHYKGLVLMLDEAHLLAESLNIIQQLRYVLRDSPSCGLIFAGERVLNQMFTDSAAPFYQQARIIPVQNFVFRGDVAECALMPLTDAERLLMSPMTVSQLYRLSHGKPNQIRLICHSVYRRYQRNDQKDLSITLEALDDVLDLIQASYTSEYDLRQRVDMIRRLPSVDLEALYLITRYPEWHARDVVSLDEAFRGEKLSSRAAARRTTRLEEKRQRFIGMGLLQDGTDKYALTGDEFLQFYLRLWYEVRKYGALRKRIDLREVPPTPFGEKTDKLVRSLAWAVGRLPAMVMVRFSSSDARETETIARIKRRHELLEATISAGVGHAVREAELLTECLELCNLVARGAPYYLLVVSVRNLENPRESILLEIYFDGDKPLTFPLNLITRHAEAARILVEEFDSWAVRLPSLEELVKAISGRTLDEVIEKSGGVIGKWMILSIKKMVEDSSAGSGKEDREKDEESESAEWVELYESGKVAEAIERVTRQLAKNPQRPIAARLYNNRGYMRCEMKAGEEGAKRDLERALDLHFRDLALTLLNLGVMAIDQSTFAEAIERIEDALLITLGQESIRASFLRLRVLGGNLLFTRRERWEQHPANVLEAAYVNLGYAVARERGHEAGKEVLEEGLELVPSSTWLRHALARLYLSQRRADLADSLYDELAEMKMPDGVLTNEVKMYRQLGGRRGRKR